MHWRFTPLTALTISIVLMLSMAALPTFAQGERPPKTIRSAPLSDRVIGLAVEKELLSAQGINAHRLDAESRQGIVTLAGKVDNLRAKQRASEVAQHVKGVAAVVNQIFVVPEDQNDQTIQDNIYAAWAEEPVTEPSQLEAEVKAGIATLSGTVDSQAEKTLAGDIVAGVQGVTEVKNNIQVEEKTDRSDQEIREDVQTLLGSAVELGNAEIDVQVEDGDVVLNGRVGTAYARSIAKRKAQVAGVENVDARGIEVDADFFDGTRRRKRLEQITDSQIVKTIRLALAYDPRVLSYLDNLEVESEDGSVTLTGQVGRLRAKEAAEKVARSTLGVWRVENYLKVRWSGKDPSSKEIIDNVQAALKRDPYVSRYTIRVHCRNAHVSLYGLVDTKFEKEVAGWIAGGQKGVVHVNNSLAIADKWEPKSDAEIKADLEDKLKFTFFDKSNQIEVTVEDGVAILRGEVDTWRGWQTAMEKALEAGARRPHNLLKVRYHPRHGGSRIYVPE